MAHAHLWFCGGWVSRPASSQLYVPHTSKSSLCGSPARDRAARITEAPDLWELERWLGERRRRIDRTFDYRYSVLPVVFANLLRDGRLSENDLHGLDLDKLDAIRHMVHS
ncbi:MAG: hypothetical protein WAM66_14360 [Acidobacteriaceae bacterium]